jgi:hypothetical protein
VPPLVVVDSRLTGVGRSDALSALSGLEAERAKGMGDLDGAGAVSGSCECFIHDLSVFVVLEKAFPSSTASDGVDCFRGDP